MIDQFKETVTYPLHIDGLVDVHVPNSTIQLTPMVQQGTVSGRGKLGTLTKPRQRLKDERERESE